MPDTDTPTEPTKPRRSRWRTVLRVVLIILAVGAFWIAWTLTPVLLAYLAPHPRVTVSEETTYVLGPLREDGYVDYVAAFNERASEGVTHENNAAIPLLDMMGNPEDSEQEEYFELLLEAMDQELLNKELRFKDLATFVADDMSGRAAENPFEPFKVAQLRPWSESEFPQLYRWIVANEGPLKRIAEATKRPHCFVPLLVQKSQNNPPFVMALLPPGTNLREAARALTVRAMMRAELGDFDGAFQDVFVCHRLGRLLGQSSITVQWMQGLSIDLMAARTSSALVHDRRTSREMILRFRRQVDELPRHVPVLGRFFEQRYMALDTVCGMATGVLVDDDLRNLPWYFQPDYDAALRQVNQAGNLYEEVLGIRDRRQRREKLKLMEIEFEQQLQASKTEWYLSTKAKHTRMCAQLAMIWSFPSQIAFIKMEDTSEVSITMTDTAMAMALYRFEHGEYPESLEELIPKFLDEVPQDWFGEGDIRYRPEGQGYVMWSSGDNEIDDDGDAELDTVIRMPIRDEDVLAK